MKLADDAPRRSIDDLVEAIAVDMYQILNASSDQLDVFGGGLLQTALSLDDEQLPIVTLVIALLRLYREVANR